MPVEIVSVFKNLSVDIQLNMQNAYSQLGIKFKNLSVDIQSFYMDK